MSKKWIASIVFDNFCKEKYGKVWLLTIFFEAITRIVAHKKMHTILELKTAIQSQTESIYTENTTRFCTVSLFICTKYELHWTHFGLRNHSPKCVEKSVMASWYFVKLQESHVAFKAPYKILILYMILRKSLWAICIHIIFEKMNFFLETA
jgi:hypothetical protein